MTTEEPREWLIRKGGYFYRPNCAGYTTSKVEAGRYTKAKAEAEASVEPWHMSAIHQSSVPDEPSIVGLYEEIAALKAERDELLVEVERLKKRIPEEWYWPADDTSSDACGDHPRDVLEDLAPGEIGSYSCGGVSYTAFYGWLPPADDADSDDEFEVDEPTQEEAETKMKAEIERRANIKESGNADS